MRWLLLWLLAALALAPSGSAQNLKLTNPGTGFVPLDGQWQFHLGDDTSWADPRLDDSTWETISAGRPWGAQGHPGHVGFAWYRRHIQIDTAASAVTNRLAVSIPLVQDAYDIYWNGQKLGSYGELPPKASWYTIGHQSVYALPGSEGVLALRVWKAPLASVDFVETGGLTATPLLGDLPLLQGRLKLIAYTRDERSLPNLLMSTVSLVIGILSLLLYLRERTQGLYLWLALYLLAAGITQFQFLSPFQNFATFHVYQVTGQLESSVRDISLWMILISLFGLIEESRWRRATGWIVAIYLTAQFTDIITLLFWEKGGILPWIDGISTAVYSVTPLYVFAIIGFGVMRRKRWALWPLIIVVGVTALATAVLNLTGQGIRFTHWTLNDRLSRFGLHVGDYFLDIQFLLGGCLFLALIFTVAREQFLERERQTKVEMELKSAREIQQILIPEQAPAIPGLVISSVYRPAEEVGGDFFQIIDLDGVALIAVGDVSGKGLKAAMTVSLIVGALRAQADATQSPAAILQGLNRRLLGRTDGGFVTCVICRIDADGSTVIANAGHLSPYLDRNEMPVAGSLPLGLVGEPAYQEQNMMLQAGETLTFFTDGLLEARNQAGEIFGFDRLAALVRSDPTVEQMVEEACRFGQEDDITIFRVTRLAESAPSHASRLILATQIAGA